MGFNLSINIDAELKKIHEDNEEQGKQTACLFNLIIYAHEVRRIPYFERILNNILEKFPCRVIFVEGEPEVSGVLEVNVSSVDAQIGENLVACDHIGIRISDSELSSLPFLILPILVADLPVFLVWGRDPCDQDPVLSDLLRISNRLILDSECTQNLSQFSKKVLQWMQNSSLDIVDMNWAFISGWREVLAEVFAVEEKIQELEQLTNIQVVYNALQSPDCLHLRQQATYFQAWLASRLNWQFVEKESSGKVIAYESKKGKVNVHFTPVAKEELLPGSIVAVELRTPHSEFSFQRIGSVSKVLAHVTIDDRCDMPMTAFLPNVRGGLTFQREVFYGSPSPQYEEMLQYLAARYTS